MLLESDPGLQSWWSDKEKLEIPRAAKANEHFQPLVKLPLSKALPSPPAVMAQNSGYNEPLENYLFIFFYRKEAGCHRDGEKKRKRKTDYLPWSFLLGVALAV